MSTVDLNTVVNSVCTGNLTLLNEILQAEPNLVLGTDSFARTPLHYAALYGQHKEISCLISFGANVNANDQYGMTPLMVGVYEEPLVSESDRLSSIRLLLESGADVNLSDIRGDTALHTAAWAVERETAKLLMSYGADPTAQNNDGKSPLDLAQDEGNGHDFFDL